MGEGEEREGARLRILRGQGVGGGKIFAGWKSISWL